MSGTSLLPLKYFKFVQGNVLKGQLEINRDASDHTHEKRKLDCVYEQVFDYYSLPRFTRLTSFRSPAVCSFFPHTITELLRCFSLYRQYGGGRTRRRVSHSGKNKIFTKYQ
jgi:hypothetical protein